MDKKSIGQTIGKIIEGTLKTIFGGIMCSPVILIILVGLVIVYPLSAIDKLGKLISINVGQLAKLLVCVAVIGFIGYFGIVIVIGSNRSWLVKIFGSFLWVPLAGIVLFGLVDAISKLIRPNIPKMTRSGDVLGLIRALKYDNWEARHKAAEALRETGDNRAVEPLKVYDAAVAWEQKLDWDASGGRSPFL